MLVRVAALAFEALRWVPAGIENFSSDPHQKEDLHSFVGVELDFFVRCLGGDEQCHQGFVQHVRLGAPLNRAHALGKAVIWRQQVTNDSANPCFSSANLFPGSVLQPARSQVEHAREYTEEIHRHTGGRTRHALVVLFDEARQTTLLLKKPRKSGLMDRSLFADFIGPSVNGISIDVCI